MRVAVVIHPKITACASTRHGYLHSEHFQSARMMSLLNFKDSSLFEGSRVGESCFQVEKVEKLFISIS